jgi:hypothetical protein
MSTRIFTEEEQKILRNSPHVSKCSERSMTFTPEFKAYAVHASRDERRKPQDIFITAGIPLDIIGRKAPKYCLREWLAKNPESLKRDGRGKHGNKSGRKCKERADISKMTSDEKIKYFEARIAYVDAENDFLAKARGIKRIPFAYRPGKNTD